MVNQNLTPILLCAPTLRQQVKKLTERLLPLLKVVSVAEVPNTVSVQAFEVIQVPQSTKPMFNGGNNAWSNPSVNVCHECRSAAVKCGQS